MGGVPNIGALLQQQPSIEQTAAQIPNQQAQINQQNQAPQQQPQQPPQSSDSLSAGLDAAAQHYTQQLQEASKPFGIKQMLTNFFAGMSHGMLPVTQSPEFQQNRALQGLQAVAATKAHLSTMQSVMAEAAPVPLIGMDDKPVMGPNGQPITLPANQARSIYAAREAGQYRQAIQQNKDAAANPILSDQQAEALGHKEWAGMELNKALSGLIGQQSKNDTAETIAKGRDLTAATIARGHDLARMEVAKVGMMARASKDPNALTNTMKTMKQQAISTLPGIDRALDETQQVAGKLGPVEGRWNDFWQGKVGADDPTFSHYKDEIGMVSSAVTLAHARGRMSNELFEHFQQMFDAGKQSPGNMTQALNVAKEWLTDYAKMGDTPTPNAPAGGLSKFQQYQLSKGRK